MITQATRARPHLAFCRCGVPENQRGANDRRGSSFFPAVYGEFLARGFSGRVDLYHRIGRVQGVPAIGLGLAARCTGGPLDTEWWSQFRIDLFNSFKDAGLPAIAARSDTIMTLGEITAKFSELLLSIEFEAGHVIAKRLGAGM